ncbi:FAD-dependent oxidoreductase [Thermomonospora amylolytica]|uniref:FAD-dependent oxidoreductase n=1 Tax=Thermomonospora amylolytica TaxID=1411117 RepID=UPI000E6D09DF|nr:FAD-dependent oxidoreductase [Thermomonospora amylolytica]
MTHVLVVGAGMAGARLAAEIARRDAAGRIDLTVVGSEPHPPYNRVQLTELLAGRTTWAGIALEGPAWFAERGYALRLGTPVRAIDRAARRVLLGDGDTLPYDVLVLATGAEPVMPLPGPLPAGVFTFRTLDDCHAIAATAARAREAVVVGGGLLGLETARGLARLGARVTVVHAAPRLMERHLDDGAARILRRIYAGQGIEVELNATVAAVSGGDRVEKLVLSDGRTLPADLVVVSCGVRPRTGLAAACGLRVERGVVVDDDLRTSDPHIHAIGDCAQHRGVAAGLLDPAWEQARLLAVRLTDPGAADRYTGVRSVTRLKAPGIDLVAMGESGTEPSWDDDGPEVVVFRDGGRGVYKKLVLRDERLVGALLLGDDSTAGVVAQFFDRGDRVPSDPAALLFAGWGGAAPAARDAVVCRCNGVTREAVARACAAGARDLAAVSAATRCGTGCGTCRADVERLIAELARASVTAG